MTRQARPGSAHAKHASDAQPTMTEHNHAPHNPSGNITQKTNKVVLIGISNKNTHSVPTVYNENKQHVEQHGKVSVKSM